MKFLVTASALICSAALCLAQESPRKSPNGLNDPSSSRLTPPSTASTSTSATANNGKETKPASLWTVIENTGWPMVPLGGLSVLTGMLVVGFAISLRRGSIVSRQYTATIEVLIRKRDYLGVLAVSNRHSEA